MTGRRVAEKDLFRTARLTLIVPEKVPAKYNVQSKLTVAVKPEENVFDLEIASQQQSRPAQQSP